MSWLDLVLKRAPDRKPEDEPLAPVYIMAGQPVRFLSTEAIGTSEAAFRKCPQLFRITNFISATVQSVPWYCEPDENTVAMDRAGPSAIKAINEVLKNPNENYTAPQMRYWIALNLMLYGRAHFKVGIGAAGYPNGIYPLAAKYTRGLPNNRGSIDGYEYGLGSENSTKWPTRRMAEKRNPTIPYASEISFPTITGMVEYNKQPAAIECLATPLALVTALMRRALDAAEGHPNIKYVITAEKTLTKAQKDALHKYLEESRPGEDNSGNVLFLYNTDIKVHPLDNKLGDIHSKIPLDDMTRQIAGVFGVPIPLLGLGSSDAAKFTGNYAESRLAFYQDTILPTYLVPIAAGMTNAICPPGACIKFDLDAVPALWQGRADLGKTLSLVTCLTTNEKRAVLDFPPTDDIPAIMPAVALPNVGAPAPPSADDSPDDPAATDPTLPDSGKSQSQIIDLPMRSRL
jgi:phage portal protein BeeE